MVYNWVRGWTSGAIKHEPLTFYVFPKIKILITLQFEWKEGPDLPPLVIPVFVPFFSWLPSFNQPFVECEIFSILHQRLLTLKRVLLISTMDNKHSTLHFYHHHLRHLSHTSIIQQRLQLFNLFNGDAFYPLSVWPQGFKLIFWKKKSATRTHSNCFYFQLAMAVHLT